MNRARRLRFAIAALTALTLAVGALALSAHVALFPPQYHGWSEIVGGANLVNGNAEIAGWVVNTRAPDERVQVQLYIGGRFIGAGVADISRPDVVAAGFAVDARCGYRFPLPALPVGSHVARVYAVHATRDGRLHSLQLTGEPLTFTIAGN